MIRSVLYAVLLVVSFSVAFTALVPSVARAASCPSGKILTLKPWYDGLLMSDCSVKSPGSSKEEQSKFIWRIALNIVEDLLQIAAYVSFGYVIYGGFTFITSTGSPDKATAGRKTLINALVGLVVAIAAVTLVDLIARVALGIK